MTLKVGNGDLESFNCDLIYKASDTPNHVKNFRGHLVSLGFHDA